MLTKQFAFGDRVVHAGRPEWGTGIVSAAVPDTQEGKSCQRVTIRFERVGIKTLSTGVANLVPAEDAPAMVAAEANPADPFAGGGSDKSARELMLKLPDGCTDPFQPPRVRLEATARLFRFNEHGGSLIDWAAAQSGLKDPMTRFNRHELEDLFKRWVMTRDEHLKKLIWEMKKQDPVGLSLAVKGATGKAQAMMRRFDTGR
ncbi:MAG: DUF3553 domain-containing protein [Phycisphaerales bacterium]|nr:DUF3553 domain-containing protein [Phycisphaerales bacterium]